MWFTSAVAPERRFQRYTWAPEWSFVTGRKVLPWAVKATELPSALIAQSEPEGLTCVIVSATRSKRKMPPMPLTLFGTRLLASLWKARYRPSALREGFFDPELPVWVGEAMERLTSRVWPVARS